MKTKWATLMQGWKRSLHFSSSKESLSTFVRSDTMEILHSCCAITVLLSLHKLFQGKMLTNFDRVGSLHSNIYIVNEDLKLSDLKTSELTGSFESLSISFSNLTSLPHLFLDKSPILSSKGLIVSPEYQQWALRQLGIPSSPSVSA